MFKHTDLSIIRQCPECGKTFNADDAEFDFGEVFMPISYFSFYPLICAECAIKAVREKKRGVNFEPCDLCNKEMDVIEENEKYRKLIGTDEEFPIIDMEKISIYCCDCLKKINKI